MIVTAGTARAVVNRDARVRVFASMVIEDLEVFGDLGND